MNISINTVATAALGLFLIACTEIPPSASGQTGETQQVCSYEIATGTSIPRRQCHAPLTDAQREMLQRELRDSAVMAPTGN